MDQQHEIQAIYDALDEDRRQQLAALAKQLVADQQGE